MGVGIFSDCVFFLKVNSLPHKARSELKNSITSQGGAISFVLNEKCTHVVVVSATVLNSSHRKKIQKHGITIVKPDFIWKSIQEKRLVESGLADDGRRSEATQDDIRGKKESRFLEKYRLTKADISEEDPKDDEMEEGEDEQELPPDTEVAKYCFFKKGEEVVLVEILCFSKQHPFRYKVSTVCGTLGSSQKEFAFNLTRDAEKACEKYEQRIKDLKNKGFKQIDQIPPEAEYFATQALHKVLLGEALNATRLCSEVGSFVESIWVEAQGHLLSVLSCPVANISLNDVSKAEGILQLVRDTLNKKESEANISQMMQEFYQSIPHTERMLRNIDKKFLTAKQDLCQLIRDMLNVCETNSSGTFSSSVAKYRALRCRIEFVDPNTEEFQRVKREVLDNNHCNGEFQILRVFRIGRLSETINFESDLGNIKSLFHASSPRNFVGILSRGLQMPKIIIDEFGLERTDIGNLGSGIYLSDSISTSVKYTKVSDINGVRLLLVCDVALGKTKDVTKRDFSITEAPEGFHSIHGVGSYSRISDFTDDEYVVYNVNQVKMRYIVQFCTNADSPNLQYEPTLTLEERNNELETCEPTEGSNEPVEDLPEEEKIKGGLQGMDGQQIPLQNIYVKARLMDLAAQVVIFQTYKNNSVSPIEAKYVFPLDSTAAVCGFEAFINGKHIVGEVKEKQQAHREYRTAIREGHGAYLMDQAEPDVFTVSVGNLPAKATVIIKITYVTELECRYGYVTFSIPGAVASWQQDQALKENTQDTVAKLGIDSDTAAQASFCLDMSIEMPRKIDSVGCATHEIKIKRTDCKAVIKVKEGSSLTDYGFNLDIRLEDADIPRMWVETHPEKDSEACMLIFQPQLEYECETEKMIICLDCSNSMESCFTSAKRIALLALSTLSYCSINVITFGSTYKEFYFFPKKPGDDIAEIEKFIKAAKPNMGSTEFWKPLQSLCLLRPSSGKQALLLISDGHLQNDNLVFQLLKKYENIQLFTCGVGSTANKHMLRCLANHGSGAFEYFADKSKSSWKDQMNKQHTRLLSPACTEVSVKWKRFERDPPAPVQAPAYIQSLFSNDSVLVYGFIARCTQATLKALINNKEFENMVSTTELQKTKGTILHKLTARALIRDYEDGILSEKEHQNEMEKKKMKFFIINLSKEYSIVTQFTSFIAVEKRSEEAEIIEPDIAKILAAEQVDILPYMEYEGAEDDDLLVSGVQSDADSLVFQSEMDPLELFSQSRKNLLFLDSADSSLEEPDTVEPLVPSMIDFQSSFDSIENLEDHLPCRSEELLVSNMYKKETEAQISSLSAAPVFDLAELVSGSISIFDSAAPAFGSGSTIFGSAGPVIGSESTTFGTPVPKCGSTSSLFGSASTVFAPALSRTPHPTPSYLRGSPGPTIGSASKFRFRTQAFASESTTFGSAASVIGSTPSQLGSASTAFASAAPTSGSASMFGFGPPTFIPAVPLLDSFPPPPASRAPGFGSKAEKFHSTANLDVNLGPPAPQPEPQGFKLFPCLPISLAEKPLPPPPPPSDFTALSFVNFTASKKPCALPIQQATWGAPRLHSRLFQLTWSSFSLCQSQEGYWMLTPQLGRLLNIDVGYLCDTFLAQKGVSSLGSRGKDEILKLIATLLVLQTIRHYNLLTGIKFKTLMKLDQCDLASEPLPSIQKAINWAVKTDRQYPGICNRLSLGRDWDHATRQLLKIEPPSSDLYKALHR